jgi:hypothetical protein
MDLGPLYIVRGKVMLVGVSFINLVNKRLIHKLVLKFCCRSCLLVTILVWICDMCLRKRSSMELTLLIGTATWELYSGKRKLEDDLEQPYPDAPGDDAIIAYIHRQPDIHHNSWNMLVYNPSPIKHTFDEVTYIQFGVRMQKLCLLEYCATRCARRRVQLALWTFSGQHQTLSGDSTLSIISKGTKSMNQKTIKEGVAAPTMCRWSYQLRAPKSRPSPIQQTH